MLCLLINMPHAYLKCYVGSLLRLLHTTRHHVRGRTRRQTINCTDKLEWLQAASALAYQLRN